MLVVGAMTERGPGDDGDECCSRYLPRLPVRVGTLVIFVSGPGFLLDVTTHYHLLFLPPCAAPCV